MIKLENKGHVAHLSTGQVIGITRVGYSSLYNYVREFGEFFSPGVNQHKRGRKWSPDDLGIVESIRCLRHERKGTDQIREMLTSGWRVENNKAWSKEERARLVEVISSVVEETNRIVEEAIKEIKDSQYQRVLTSGDHLEVERMSQRLKEIEQEFKILESHWKIKDWVRREKEYENKTGRRHLLSF